MSEQETLKVIEQMADGKVVLDTLPESALELEGDWEAGWPGAKRMAMQASLYAALAKAQAAFPPIPRDRTVQVQTRTGGTYTFSYAPLDTIFDKVRPALAAENLAVTQLLDAAGERSLLRTQLLHAGGGMIESVWSIRDSGTAQEFGSALTYLRRYALVALLGIASEEDDDGNTASGNTATQQNTRQEATGAAESAAKPAAGENQRDKNFRAAKALERKLIDAGLTEEQFQAQLAASYDGLTHVSDLSDEQLADLVKRLREAERKLKEKAQ